MATRQVIIELTLKEIDREVLTVVEAMSIMSRITEMIATLKQHTIIISEVEVLEALTRLHGVGKIRFAMTQGGGIGLEIIK